MTVGGTGSGLYRLPVGDVPVKKSPSVAASDQSCLILEPPPETFPLVGLLGGTGSSHVPVKLSRTPSSVVSSDQPCLILEPPPEAFPLV